jgi:hypothetical protein
LLLIGARAAATYAVRSDRIEIAKQFLAEARRLTNASEPLEKIALANLEAEVARRTGDSELDRIWAEGTSIYAAYRKTGGEPVSPSARCLAALADSLNGKDLMTARRLLDCIQLEPDTLQAQIRSVLAHPESSIEFKTKNIDEAWELDRFIDVLRSIKR